MRNKRILKILLNSSHYLRANSQLGVGGKPCKFVVFKDLLLFWSYGSSYCTQYITVVPKNEDG